MQLTLKEITKVQTSVREEDCYTYTDEAGEEFKFHFHPTRAFYPIFLKGDRSKLVGLVSAFVNAGLSQHSFAGGFNEAIQTLNLN